MGHLHAEIEWLDLVRKQENLAAARYNMGNGLDVGGGGNSVEDRRRRNTQKSAFQPDPPSNEPASGSLPTAR